MHQGLPRDLDLPIPVLHPALPLPLVVAAVGPGHLPETVAEVLHELALIAVPCGPLINSVSTLPVVDVLAFVLVLGLIVKPDALAVPQSILEVPAV